MRLPRDVSGVELMARLRRRYGYVVIRQNGSHIQLVGYYMGYAGHITVPRHSPVRVGTLTRILNIAAAYLEMDRDELVRELFSR